MRVTNQQLVIDTYNLLIRYLWLLSENFIHLSVAVSVPPRSMFYLARVISLYFTVDLFGVDFKQL